MAERREIPGPAWSSIGKTQKVVKKLRFLRFPNAMTYHLANQNASARLTSGFDTFTLTPEAR